MMRPERIGRLANEVAKRFADEGKLIAAGWASYQMLVLPPDAPQTQIDECRTAFMAGAQHLFGSLMGILDPGEAETASDLHKMELIDKELKDFASEMKKRLT